MPMAFQLVSEKVLIAIKKRTESATEKTGK
jgi:hypothetical protein